MENREAVVVILVNELDSKILSVTRKDNPLLFCFPGGKLDANESPFEAAIRETKEETSVILQSGVYLGSLHDGEYLTHCYLATDWYGDPVDQEPGVHVKWLTEEEIGNTLSAYPQYNTEMINRSREYRAAST